MSLLSELRAKIGILRDHVTMEPRIRESLRRIDGKLLLLLDNQLDIRSVRPADGCLRLRQEIGLLILRIIDTLAKRNGIPYWLMYGTLLGAVRHGGFVPWDDDLDISLMEDDYEKLFSLLSSNLPHCLSIERWTTREHPRLGIARVVDDSSGCAIDVYPNLFVPGALSSGNEETAWEQEFLRFSNEIVMQSSYKPLTNNDRAKIRTWIDNHRQGDGDIAGIAVSPEHTTFGPSYRVVFCAEEILPLSSIQFEGFSFPAPARPDEVLRKLYDVFERFPGDAGVANHSSDPRQRNTRILRASIDRLHSELDQLNKA